MPAVNLHLALWFWTGLLGFLIVPAFAQTDEFFETRVRPILVEHCYTCHNTADNAEGGLALDWRDGIRSESGNGTAVVPGNPDDSLLLKVIRHEIPGLEMPEGGPQLSRQVIADLERWISEGARDPRDRPPSAEQLQNATSWEAVFERRKKWWSLLPAQSQQLPPENRWSNHPIDRYIFQGMRQQGLAPAAPAAPLVLLRRLSFALTGLPPDSSDVKRLLQEPEQFEFQDYVDRYLESPHFGEHWARHWMDLVRYADSHGSEGDPAIPNIYRYRDYLVRAFNQDVPYDQLVREHIAGDLLDEPRQNRQLGINESAIGTAFWRLVFHGFAPTDALDEKVRFTDDQINVFSKAFQGLTVSCARCHDHKFDAISQADYYALFGVLGSCRPAMQDVNLPARQQFGQRELDQVKSELRKRLSEHWLNGLDQLPGLLKEPGINQQAEKVHPVLVPLQWFQARTEEGLSLKQAAKKWNQHLNQLRKSQSQDADDHWQWELGQADGNSSWIVRGNGLARRQSRPGEFTMASQTDQIVAAIFPSCLMTHAYSDRHRGVLGSPRVRVPANSVAWVQLAGQGKSSVRYAVQNYPRDGTVYPIHEIGDSDWHWRRLDLNYWAGDDIHLELSTANDAPLVTRGSNRSWFAIRKVMIRDRDKAAPTDNHLELWSPLVDALSAIPLDESTDILQVYHQALQDSLSRWRDDDLDDASARFLNGCLQAGLLDNTLEKVPAAAPLVERYREVEAGIPLPTRVPGIVEAEAYDQPLFERGNHRKPGPPVPRRYLSAIDGQPFGTNNSGRLKLAEAVVSPDNPLTARVFVNRLWLYLFGQGLVATPDNFGQMGELPSHPELLDYLAVQLVQNHWSVKTMVREMLLTRTWQQSSNSTTLAEKLDPGNRLLSHANVRRLEAEAIRDSIVYTTDKLDRTLYGPPVAANSNTLRRSVYVRANRNNLDKFLRVFDAPVPFSTTGRRHQTNVPAQSLAMLNSPLVWHFARQFGENLNELHADNKSANIELLFQRLFARRATTQEVAAVGKYLDELQDQRLVRLKRRIQLQTESDQIEKQWNELYQPVQSRLAKNESADASMIGHSLFEWDFRKSLESGAKPLTVQLRGSAKQTELGLELDGQGFAVTPPLETDVQSKTLEAWVIVSDLDQRGGGLFTIQTLDGGVFDSIVLGEQQSRHWLAGSNLFARTEPFQGQPENTTDQPIHVALVYQSDGTITGYRNGVTYGRSIRKSNLQLFAAGDVQLVFGLRHGTAVSGGRMLKAVIVAARFHDRPLEPDEIRASSQGQVFISRQDVLSAMTEKNRQKLLNLETRKDELARESDQLGEVWSESEPWARVVHALFNLKEFMFIQ